MDPHAPAYLSQPLQPPYDFDPVDGLLGFAQYVTQQAIAVNQSALPHYKVCGNVACYASKSVKDHYLKAVEGLDEPTVAAYKAGCTVSTLVRDLPAKQGGVGIIVSPLNNAAGQQQGWNEWHAVVLLRKGRAVWVWDHAYQMNSQTRLANVPGHSNTVRVIAELKKNGKVDKIWIQGWNGQGTGCMGRSAQFLDNVIRAPGALDPIPPGTFNPEEDMDGWQLITLH